MKFYIVHIKCKIVENIKSKVCLLIIDGFGVAPPSKSNAITMAKTPTWDMLQTKYPWRSINASGNYVGLPDGVMGNSEVGHLTIGAGRIIYQSLELINRSLNDGSLEQNHVISEIVKYLNNSGGRLHLMGLLSDGGVHSHQKHLHKLIEIFSNKIKNKIFIHAFTDGRDTPPDSSVDYIQQLKDFIADYPQVSISTVIGRYYAMDRDKKWERTKIAYDALIKNRKNIDEDVIDTIKQRYKKGETDEFLKPIILCRDGIINNGDAVLFFNFRPDRARQITMAINGDWPYESKLLDIYYATMTRYEKNWTYPVMFDTAEVHENLAEILSYYNLKQIHIAETEKYAHVTYFLNGGIEKQYPGEDRILIPSLKVATYDLQPSMSTIEIAESAVKAINSNNYHFVVLNIAAPDMVGHTGNMSATIKALEFTDKAINMIYNSCIKNNYILIIIGDHGNCEKMFDENGNPFTAHTTNPVPFLVTSDLKINESIDAGLANVAPSILCLMGLNKPECMSYPIIKCE